MLRRHRDHWIDKEKLGQICLWRVFGQSASCKAVMATSKIAMCLYIWEMAGGGDQAFWEALGIRLSFVS